MRAAMQQALDEAERQLRETGAAEAATDEDLGWSFDGPDGWTLSVLPLAQGEVAVGSFVVTP